MWWTGLYMLPSEHHAKGPEHVAAGYKATIRNPHVSNEAKYHAWKELHKMGIHDLDQPIHEALDQPLEVFDQPIHLVPKPPLPTSAGCKSISARWFLHSDKQQIPLRRRCELNWFARKELGRSRELEKQEIHKPRVRAMSFEVIKRPSRVSKALLIPWSSTQSV
jgi:hypothetical protein